MMSQRSYLLRDSAVTAKTLEVYRKAVHGFLRYTQQNGEIATRIEHMDELASEYIEHLYVSDGKKYIADNLKCGLQHFYPRLKNQLLETSRALRGWKKEADKLRVARPPLSEELVNVLALTLAKSGHYAAGIATLVAFHCYLRIGELTSLRLKDVALAGTKGRAVGGLTLTWKQTKAGHDESVSVMCPTIAALLTEFIVNKSRTAADTETVFGITSVRYRELFRNACDINGIGGVGFVPHCLRHGGATHDFLLGMSIESVLKRGRWAVSKSARTYIHSGQAMLVSVNVPGLQALGNRLNPHMYRHMSQFA